METFSNFASIEKLLVPLVNKESAIVGASHRNPSGHWKLACFQSNMQWYRFRLIEGYDLLSNNYAYCDYVSGPFAARTDLLKDSVSSTSNDMQGDAFYLDLMWRLTVEKKVVMLCVECLFHTRTSGIQSRGKNIWLPFIRKYKLNLMTFHDGSFFEYSCGEAGIGCESTTGKFLSFCCHKELQDLALFICKTLSEHNIGHEIDSGSVLGSVKLDNTLLWEKDHDYNLRYADFPKLMSLRSVFKSARYSLNEERVDQAKCRNNIFCGYVGISSRNWRAEMWGINTLNSDIFREGKRKIYDADHMGFTPVKANRTLTRLGKSWVNAYSNPAAYSRGHYGVSVLQHAQHWSDTGGSSSFDPYFPGRWKKCKTPGFHGCADIFLADGNLQFREVWA